MKRTIAYLLSLVLAALMVACAPPTAAPPAPAPPPTTAPAAVVVPPKAIRIGASLSLTGRYDRTGKEEQNGYKLWEEQINAKGGVLGRKVELIIYDDKSDPETAAKLYEKLITEDKVDLILGPYSSPVTLPASTVTEKYKYPMIAAGASETGIWTRGYKYVFGIYTLAPFYLDGAIDLAKKQGYKTVAAVNENSAFAKDAIKSAKEKAKAAGMTVVFEEEYGRDVKDLSPMLTKIKALNPDMLLGGTYGEDATLLVRQSKDLNWTPKIMALTVGPALPDFNATLKADADYIYGATQWEPGLKGVTDFVNAYKAKYGYEPGYHAAGGYAAAQLLQQAIEKIKAVDNEKLRDTLATMEATTIYGAYKVDATGAQTAKPSYLVQWQKGKRVLVWPDSVAEAQPVLPMPAWNAR